MKHFTLLCLTLIFLGGCASSAGPSVQDLPVEAKSIKAEPTGTGEISALVAKRLGLDIGNDEASKDVLSGGYSFFYKGK